MKKFRKVLLAILVLIILIALFFTVDYIRVKGNNSPIFCIKTNAYKDGGSAEYIGLGYKVYKYVGFVAVQTKYEIGSLFMKFNNPFTTDISSTNYTYTDIPYISNEVHSHLYFEGYNNPNVDIIKSTSDLTKYTNKYKDDKLASTLNKYTNDYFNNNVLVIVTVQENSGSITDKVERVAKIDNTNALSIFVNRSFPEIGTEDMAMWHLLVEINKTDFNGINNVAVFDTTGKSF